MPITGDATVITIRALSITDPVYSITGYILDDEASGLNLVTVTLSGDASAEAISGAGLPIGENEPGLYKFTGLSNGDYVVTPTKAGYKFIQPLENVTIAYDNEIVDDMVGTQIWVISGYILDGDSAGVEGVTITLTGDASTETETDADGYYEFDEMYDGDYTITPTLTDYTFTADHEDVTVAAANVVVDTMVGEQVSTSLPYLIDWDDGIVPGAVTSVLNYGGDSPSVSSQAAPACDTGGYTPSTTPVIYAAQSALSAGYNATRLLFSPSLPFDLSGGLRIEAMVYDDQDSDGAKGYRYWVQFIDVDDANGPYIGFFIASGDGYNPDDLRIIERRVAASGTILDSTTGGNVADTAKHWFKLRMSLPVNLSGVVTCSASAMGAGGYTGTERAEALQQNWSAFTTGKVSIQNLKTSDADIKLYVAYVWVGSLSDAWPV